MTFGAEKLVSLLACSSVKTTTKTKNNQTFVHRYVPCMFRNKPVKNEPTLKCMVKVSFIC